jgi:hypothetical protein
MESVRLSRAESFGAAYRGPELSGQGEEAVKHVAARLRRNRALGISARTAAASFKFGSKALGGWSKRQQE